MTAVGRLTGTHRSPGTAGTHGGAGATGSHGRTRATGVGTGPLGSGEPGVLRGPSGGALGRRVRLPGLLRRLPLGLLRGIRVGHRTSDAGVRDRRPAARPVTCVTPAGHERFRIRHVSRRRPENEEATGTSVTPGRGATDTGGRTRGRGGSYSGAEVRSTPL
ncbi:hypothetical protein B005_2913 [Nocardiopsis alba ATCC BAA-2165]|uniref:Uncharacterized protein n=1 Tax=Nocardiopsis alba (strain ATCC BAA-2165 / BE74) TaxID=1205910 RepID=J7LFS0_NOCAA|nr:hypothetical protein B005_2913 [Nocardiopsis alba ATCC BAA-2165]